MQQTSAEDRAISRAVTIFLLFIAIWLIVLGIANLRHPSDWAMGDWLINYSAGFVRRGFTGALALLVRKLFLPPTLSIVLLQWACYATVLATIWRFCQHLRWRWWSVALVFSPATLAFVLLDPAFAFRKEILFFALLCLILQSRDAAAKQARLSLILYFGCGICVLSHEALIVFFPYVAAATWLTLKDLRRSIRLLLGPFALAAALFVLASHYPGNATTAAAICHSIGGTLTSPPSGICGGAIDYLTRTPAAAHADVLRVYSGASLHLLPWLFVLPLLPVTMALAAYWHQQPHTARVLLACALCSWLFSISLFWFATDWTRWIYIHTFSLMLLLLFAEQGREATPGASTLTRTANGARAIRWLPAAALFLYCFGWELTVYGQRPLYGSFVRYVTHSLFRG